MEPARSVDDVLSVRRDHGLPGPRVLTSLSPINGDTTISSDSLRAMVRRRKEQGADLIKIFASKSIREGGAKTMTDEQLAAACGEARAQGLRTLVHAHSADAVLSSAKAGCTEIEHGAFVSDEGLTYMADHGIYFDPNIGLVLQNYIENKPRYMGIGNYNEEGFAFMEKAVPTNYPMFKRALASKVRNVLLGLEGVIAKQTDSRYEAGQRSGAWTKVKFGRRQEFVIGGYRPNGDAIDALVVGHYEGRNLLAAGGPFVNLPDTKTSHWGEGITAEGMAMLVWVKRVTSLRAHDRHVSSCRVALPIVVLFALA